VLPPWATLCKSFFVRISPDHRRLEALLRRQWRARLAQDPGLKRKSRLAVRGDGWTTWIDSSRLLRPAVWFLAVIPLPAGWLAATVFALAVTYGRALQISTLNENQVKGAVISLYGGSDRDIQAPFRQWLGETTMWSLADGVFIFGLWWLLGSIPGWAALAGAPLFVAGIIIGPFLLSSVFPARIIGSILFGATIMTFGGLVIGKKMDLAVSEGLLQLSGILSPGGWAILMVRGLLEQQTYLALASLLIAAGFLQLRALTRAQESRIREQIFSPGDDSVPPPEEDEETGEDSGAGNPLAGELTALRGRELADYPAKPAPDVTCLRRAAWNAVVVAALAALARVEFPLPAHIRLLLFAGSLLATHAIWLPFLRRPVWFFPVATALNREAPLGAFFPVDFRTVLRTQIRRDIRTTGMASPLLFALTTIAFLIALPLDLATAAGLGFFATAFIALQVPLKWLSLALGLISSKPFRSGQVPRALIVVGVVVIALAELAIATTFAASLLVSVTFPWTTGVFALGLAGINAALGLLGAASALTALERGKADLVRPRKTTRS